jgi:citrate lyase subunit beta / citryl-CoA lyase
MNLLAPAAPTPAAGERHRGSIGRYLEEFKNGRGLRTLSRPYGVLPPVDGVTLAIDDDTMLQADVARARRLGFGGKLCIHPRQVPAIQAGFVPPAADLEWARRVIAAAETAGQNAVRLDGKLVDKPVIDRARALLQEAGTS